MNLHQERYSVLKLNYQFVLGISTIFLVIFLLAKFRFTWSYIMGITICTLTSIIIRAVIDKGFCIQWGILFELSTQKTHSF